MVEEERSLEMKEVELKGVIADPEALRARAVALGGRVVLEGHMVDLRFEGPCAEHALGGRGETLRLRVEPDGTPRIAWKGPTESDARYKVREEIETAIADVEAARAILERLGFREVSRIDRDIVTVELGQVTIRVERYPRMDVLLEVEGPPQALESVFDRLGLARNAFTNEPLDAFVRRFEARTGEPALLGLPGPANPALSTPAPPSTRT